VVFTMRASERARHNIAHSLTHSLTCLGPAQRTAERWRAEREQRGQAQTIIPPMFWMVIIVGCDYRDMAPRMTRGTGASQRGPTYTLHARGITCELRTSSHMTLASSADVGANCTAVRRFPVRNRHLPLGCHCNSGVHSQYRRKGKQTNALAPVSAR
jgi:hypothetical protein